MEIRELNTFSGTPGASDFFAMDNGIDTSKISAESLFAPLEERIDNIIAGPASSAQEVIDGRLGAEALGGVQYNTLGGAIRGQVTELYQDVTDLEDDLYPIVVNVFDVEKFAIDGPEYYSTDGYVTSVLRADSRSESNISYRIALRSGVKYAIVFDSISYPATRFQIYDPVTRVMAYNSAISGQNEIIFTPSVTGKYTVKILTSGNSCQISNLHIVNYELWRSINTISVIPAFNSNYTDDENITHAIYMAYLHGFPLVEIPFKSSGYTVETPIKMYSNVELRANKNVLFTLADRANCQMVINANMSKTSIVDKNITVNGGTWDGNHDNQDKFTTDGQGNRKTPVVGMQFAGVDNLTIKNCRVQNARLYGVLIGNAISVNIDGVDIEVGDVNNPDNGDGLHFLGPINSVAVVNCKLRSEDNCLAFNCNDADHGEYTTSGDIDNIYVNNLFINNYDGGQGILLLSSANFIHNAIIENVVGVGGYFLNLSNFGLSPNANGIYTDVHVRNVIFEMYGNWKDAITMAGQFRNATFEDLSFPGLNYRGSVTGIDILYIREFPNTPTYTDVRHLTVKDIFANVTLSDKNLFILDVAPGCTVGEVKISGIKSHNNNGVLYPVNIQGNASILQLLISNSILNNAFYGLIYIRNNTASIGTIELSNNLLVDRQSPYKILNPNNGAITRFICRDALGCGYGVEDVNAISKSFASACFASISEPNTTIYFNAGQLIADTTGNTKGWICTKSGVRYTVNRQPSTEYSRNALVMYGEYLLICTNAGTTSAGDITPIETNAFTDGTCTWRVLYKGIAEFTEI